MFQCEMEGRTNGNGSVVPGTTLTAEEIQWIGEYRLAVVKAFSSVFAEATERFLDGERLLQRFSEAVDSVLRGASFSAVDEAHNELCTARALLLNTKPRFSSIAYEPPLPGCAKSIDFRATYDPGWAAFVDVKTIKPQPKDRWEQFERALSEGWFPQNVTVGLSKEWLGGEIWHAWFAARARILEYTRELERKISECGLAGRQNTVITLALCGTGVDWHKDQLEDFVQFYRIGRHRSDDPFAKVEMHSMRNNKTTLDRTVTRFAYMKRRQGVLFPSRLIWNVQGPKDPEFDS